MPYAYFTKAGKLLAITSNQSLYPDPTVIEVEVPEGTMPNAIYLDIQTQTVKEREPFAYTIEYNRVSGLPLGTTLTITEGQFVCDDSYVEFDADTPELRIVFLDHPHFIAQYIEVPTGPETP